MCDIIFNYLDTIHIESKREFLAFFGELPENDNPNDVDLDSCLCDYDLEAYLDSKGIAYVMDYGFGLQLVDY